MNYVMTAFLVIYSKFCTYHNMYIKNYNNALIPSFSCTFG